MPSQAHEDIVNDAMGALIRAFIPLYGNNFAIIAEVAVFNKLMGIKQSPRRGPAADFYIVGPDAGIQIFAEVGHMPDGKWRDWTAPDGKPVRVLRIGYDRRASLLNPRHTPFERTVLDALETL